MVVTNITTASNFFHALRRQLAWPFRKPLIDFTQGQPASPGQLQPYQRIHFRWVQRGI